MDRMMHRAACFALFAFAGAGGCQEDRSPIATALRGPDPVAFTPGGLEALASSNQYQWTGVAVARSGRIFVNYPRWGEPFRWSVAEVLPGGEVKPYPDEAWNSWNPRTRNIPLNQWVCVQAVHVDAKDRLWVLDPASPNMEGVWAGGAKLVQIDTATDQVVRVIRFDESSAPRQSYLNDIRVDTNTDTAFITDSGLGAIVVVDLNSGKLLRRLAGSATTKADPDVTPVIKGRELRFVSGPNAGQVPQIHADGIALDAPGGRLYFQSLTGRTLHRAPTKMLADASVSEAALEGAVENLGQTVVTDGMEIDSAGNVYFTALEKDGIWVRYPDSGDLRPLVTRDDIDWPDSFAWGWDANMRSLYFTTAKIQRSPRFSTDPWPPLLPFMLFKTQGVAPGRSGSP